MANENNDKQRQSPSIPERVTFAASLLLVLALFGMLLWHGVSSARRSREATVPMAEARIEWDRVAERDGRWLVPVTVENVGAEPLEEVNVVVETTEADGKPRETDVAVTFLAEQAEETVYVVADRKPDPKQVTARVVALRTRHDARGY